MILKVRTRHAGGAPVATTFCRKATVRSDASAAVHKRRKVTAPRGMQSLALAMALGQLPSGTRLVLRDMYGREWCIRPGSRATVIELRGAA